MRQLYNALIKPKIKTVYVLILTGVIVMMSIHTNGSLNGSQLQIIRKLDEAGLPHARVNVTTEETLASDYDKLLAVLDSYKDKGVSYEAVDYGFSNTFESYNYNFRPMEFSDRGSYGSRGGLLYTELNDKDIETNRVVEGKSLDDLGLNEIALPIAFKERDLKLGDQIDFESLTKVFVLAFNRGDNPKLTEAYCRLYPDLECNEEYRDDVHNKVKVKVVSFFETSDINDFLVDSDFNPAIEFFKPDRDREVVGALVSSDTFANLSNELNTGRDWVNDLRGYLGEFPYFDENVAEWFEDVVKVEEDGVVAGSSSKKVTISYANYSRKLENDLIKDIGKIELAKTMSGETGRFRLDSLASKLDKEPMVTEVLKVLSTYVLMGVLISSFYSFYIHFRNQIRTSSKEISALLMQGISWYKILMVYMFELLMIATASSMIFVGISIVMYFVNMSDVLYSSSIRLFMQSFMYSALYFVGLALVLVLALVPFRKDVLQKFKKASQTQLSIVKLSTKGLIRELSLKRVVKYIASTVGFAFSIALVISIIVLSVSSSYHLKNLYSKDTFGMQFDYMVTHNGEVNSSLGSVEELFVKTSEYSDAQAQIFKNEGVLFMDHDLWEGNSEYYKSSEIVFVNEIKEFVPLESGKYPPYWKDLKGDPPNYDQTALLSRRHLDRRNMSKKQSDPKAGYLFYYPDETSTYEMAYEVYGTVNALYNNGWALASYYPMYISEGNMMPVITSQYVLNLKDSVDRVEFEKVLDEWRVEYISYDTLLNEFQAMNDSMNDVALLISLSVSILMSILLLINIGGLRLSVKMEIKDDDTLFANMGISSSIINRLNGSVMILRILASIVFLFIIIGLIYPRYFNDLLGAFGLFSMPGSILVPFVVGSLVAIVALVGSFFVITKRRLFVNK